jgi:hypothetical protein
MAGNLVDFDTLAERDRTTIEQLSRELSEPDPILIPHLDEDISDLAGLARLSGHLFGARRPAPARRARVLS